MLGGVPDLSTLLLFIAASAALVAIPGPAVAYIVTRAVAQGRAAGVVSALGIEAGALIHVAAAVAGLSALVASSAAAFAVVKLAGAAYLVALGVNKLRTRADDSAAVEPPAPLSRLFRQGIVVNVLNPKVAIFFVAFLPQFVDPQRSIAPQVALLGLVFVLVATVLDCAWAVAAGAVAVKMRGSRRARRALDRLSGLTFIGLGTAAALARR